MGRVMQPLITDFFSHKIHSSGPDWPNRLCAIADIFNRHSGERYESCRDRLMDDFKDVAPRISAVRTNPGWRDEITAYVTYLGVAHFQPREGGGWIIGTTPAARQHLLGEAPDVAAFMRLQLPLFQYPSAMGILHQGAGRVQGNALMKTWGYVRAGAHISPVRLLAVALQADAELCDVDLLKAQVHARELYALANHRKVYPSALPQKDEVRKVLRQIRAGRVKPPPQIETRFHVLNHMQMFEASRGKICFRPTLGGADAALLRSHFNAVVGIDAQFSGFDGCKSAAELEKRILSGSWNNYFDALVHLPGKAVRALAKDALTTPFPQAEDGVAMRSVLPPLRAFGKNVQPYTQRPGEKHPARVAADPEVTRIKMERRNVTHALMVSRLLEWLQDHAEVRKVGDSQHIDLWAELPDGRTFIFEVKSGGGGVSEQVRKGVSQLYEYRYRYSQEARKFKDARLCLVLPDEPPVDWMPDYLCRDRVISLCLHPLDSEPKFHRLCQDAISAANS